MMGRDLLLLIIIIIIDIGLLMFWFAKPHPVLPPSADLVVEYLDSNVKVYRFERSGDRCYVAIGRLHGYTVDMECQFDTWEECK